MLSDASFGQGNDYLKPRFPKDFLYKRKKNVFFYVPSTIWQQSFNPTLQNPKGQYLLDLWGGGEGAAGMDKKFKCDEERITVSGAGPGSDGKPT